MSEDHRLVGEGAVFMATREDSPLRVAHVDAAYVRFLMDEIDRIGPSAHGGDIVDSFKYATTRLRTWRPARILTMRVFRPKGEVGAKFSHLAAKGGRRKNRGRKHR